MKIKKIIFYFIIIVSSQLLSQTNNNLVFVDAAGIIRWTESNEEANFWGVNYTVPFAFSYRAIKKLGFSHEEVIDQDIQQFKRLGLNAYRIHVWDREFSDRNGNLIENEHLRLMDYLVKKLVENDIYIILTPIAWWGNGYPEPDDSTQGFSSFGSKMDLSTKPEFINAEKNYLEQFVNHVNSYTGKSYKNEPKIIAFEIINEPSLPADSAVVTNYVNEMVDVLRNANVTKPIFFNISQNPDKEQWIGVANSKVDGISFQWYPTGLVHGSTLKGNYLPHVSQYPLPTFSAKINKKAKMVYEFDAPDIAASTMYPMMASSFKNAGMQWATMFSYDPTPIAAYNAEYITHYLNLAYTPGKAIGFLIASNIFLEKQNEIIEINPKVNSTSNYSINYEEDFSLLNNGHKFIYSNTTNDYPKNLESLEHIAGVGNSEIIKYEGTGAYFLDKIEEGTWKLEVFPDAVWIKDPFGNNNLENPVARLIWSARKNKINLPKVGNDYFVYQNNENTKLIGQAKKNEFQLSPGSYIISSVELKNNYKCKLSTFDFDGLRRMTNHNYSAINIKNNTVEEIHAGDSLIISADIYTDLNDIKATVYARRFGWKGFSKIEMIKMDAFNYKANIPDELLTNGIIEYFISVQKGDVYLTYPGEYTIDPSNWGFNAKTGYQVLVKPHDRWRMIFNPKENSDNIILSNDWSSLRYKIDLLPSKSNLYSYSVFLYSYLKKSDEFVTQIYVGDEVEKYGNQSVVSALLLNAELFCDVIDSVDLRFIYSNNLGFTKRVSKHDLKKEIGMKASDYESIKYALLPRPYPTFLPYWYKANDNENYVESKNVRLEFIQIAIPLNDVKVNRNFNTTLQINEIRATFWRSLGR